MRKKLLAFILLALAFFAFNKTWAQTRFLQEVYTNLTETKNVVYDSNMSWPPLPSVPPPFVKIGLQCDIYEPASDTMQARPLVILLHTGSFLPAIFNGQTTGGRTDSATVEMCRRFARKGYVAVAMSYRLGWNPLTPNSDTATWLLLEATYRAIQDTRNCVRFFRQNASTYKIDVNRIALGGQGTGGYVALAYLSVNKQSELELEKFTWDGTTPMVNSSLLGDWRGVGGIPQLNISGDSTIPTNVHMVFNYGGAMGDSSWLESGEVPVVSFHCTQDPFAPYKLGNVVVPTTGATVINNAAGSYIVVQRAQLKGNNDIINDREYNDAFTTNADVKNDGNQALYPFNLFAQSAPWEWWDSTLIKSFGAPGVSAHNNSMLTNQDMSKTKAMSYIDTMQGFLSPRMVCALGLSGCPKKKSAGIKIAYKAIEAYPNPASSKVTLYFSEEKITSVELYDMSGRLVNSFNGYSDNRVTIERNGLPAGVYMVKAGIENGTAIGRIIFE